MPAPPHPNSTDPPSRPRTSADPAPSPRILADQAFFGTDGLRAGWSLLLYSILLVVLYFGAGLLVSRLYAGQQESPLKGPGEVLFNEALAAAAVALATLLMALIEGRPFTAFGLSLTRSARRFATGSAWGMALLALLALALSAAHLLVFDARLLPLAPALRFALEWFVAFAAVAFYEEMLFRGYLQFTLARGLAALSTTLRLPHPQAVGFWTSAALLSFGFGLSHVQNPGESPLGLAAASAIGLVFCFSLWRTGSLWWAIGFHAAWDWAQSFLFGVSDSGMLVRGRLFASHPHGAPLLSGGSTGPEGSLLVLPIILLIIPIIRSTLPRTATPLDRTQAPTPRTSSATASYHIDLPNQ